MDDKRNITFWNSFPPLVSPRIKRLLSNSVTSKKLAELIRKTRMKKI